MHIPYRYLSFSIFINKIKALNWITVQLFNILQNCMCWNESYTKSYNKDLLAPAFLSDFIFNPLTLPSSLIDLDLPGTSNFLLISETLSFTQLLPGIFPRLTPYHYSNLCYIVTSLKKLSSTTLSKVPLLFYSFYHLYFFQHLSLSKVDQKLQDECQVLLCLILWQCTLFLIT